MNSPAPGYFFCFIPGFPFLLRGQHINPLIRRLLSDFRQAILCEGKSYTEGCINKVIFMLSVPIIPEMIMKSMFANVIVIFVDRLGLDAIATVGLSEFLIMWFMPYLSD